MLVAVTMMCTALMVQECPCDRPRRPGIYEGVQIVHVGALGPMREAIASVLRAELERAKIPVEPFSDVLRPDGLVLMAKSVCSDDKAQLCALEVQAIRIGYLGRWSRMAPHHVAVWGEILLVKRGGLPAGAQHAARQWILHYRHHSLREAARFDRHRESALPS